ncbi:MAG: hypothetical protein ABI629_06100 [bacterium]
MPERAPRTWVVALLLGVGLFVVYVANARLLGAGDSIPTRRLPFSLVRQGNVDLDEFTWQLTKRGKPPYYIRFANGHAYSVSTIATALVVAPLYVLPAWWLAANHVDYDDVRARVVEVVMERVAAAALTALSAAFLFVVLRRLTAWRWALALTLVYGLGTSTWSIASQALWPHALAQLTLVWLSAVLLPPAPRRAQLVGAGVAAALMVANRPQMAMFAGLALGFVWRYQRRHVVAFVIIPALSGAALLLYNQAVFQAVTGGYGGFKHFGSFWEGLAGLFVSPNRGLLIFTPVMGFALWGAVRVWRVPVPAWLRWLTVGVGAHLLVHASFKEWWAGYTYGPRYLTDVLPALTLFLVYGFLPYVRFVAIAALAAVLAVYGVAVQAIGVYAADDMWNREPTPLEQSPGRVWDWGDLQIARSLGNGFRGGELLPVLWDAFAEPQAARIAALTAPDLAATIELTPRPDRVPAGATLPASVRITNRGTQAWPVFNGTGVISARWLVYLMVRWFDAGRPVAGVGDVLLLPRNLAPGESLTMPLALLVPSRPRQYALELRITQAIDGTRGVVSNDALRIPVRVE